ncbi:MAG TPA: SelB C-terminal domain-containing protein [Streptosporangiaceae bacterium]
MQVIATAGHVDHGKSALVRALTGMEPDRWAEERSRGLTIDLGFAWLTLPGGERLALVDVPGHERFVPNMLAGVGPVPAVLFVVAADGGWMPQSAEHLAAVDALGISRGLVAVTRADLADPGPAMAQAAAQLARSSLGEVPVLAVSSVTRLGLAELRAALATLAAGLPVPDPAAPVRLWVDRAFSITGSGTVVTGTLPAGTLHTGDELLVSGASWAGQPVRIRAIESLKEKTAQVSGIARVALNLRGTPAGQLGRGMALIEAGGWTLTSLIDVRLAGPAGTAGDAGEVAARLPREVTVHVGSARVAARVREFGGGLARLSLREPLPLHVGDRLLLRDPGAAQVSPLAPGQAHPGQAGPSQAGSGQAGPRWAGITGAVVLDVSPPAQARRGVAARARAELGGWPAVPTAADLLRRHGLLRPAALRAMGVAAPPGDLIEAAGWLVDAARWADLRGQLAQVVAAHQAADPLAPGLPVEAARAALGLPDRRLIEALAGSPPPAASVRGLSPVAGAPASGMPPQMVAPRLVVGDGYVRVAVTPAGAERVAPNRTGKLSDPPAGTVALPPVVADAVAAIRGDLAASAFRAPDAGRLRELGLDRKALAAAERAGLLLRITPEIVLAPGADRQAAGVLAGLPQPFSTAQARQALDTTRRVAIPLLEYLDRAGVTERLPDDRRRLRSS